MANERTFVTDKNVPSAFVRFPFLSIGKLSKGSEGGKPAIGKLARRERKKAGFFASYTTLPFSRGLYHFIPYGISTFC